MTTLASDLPAPIDAMLNEVVAEAREQCVDNLLSVVLFGSGAEGRLRQNSDVNLILVLRRFERAQIDALRGSLRAAGAAIRLATMFILADELPLAASVFADKFADIKRRHKVLYGTDPFADLDVPRAAVITRNRQSLLNAVLRLREAYAHSAGSGEQAARAIGDAAPPLRAAAAALAELRGAAAESPRAALIRFALDCGEQRFAAAVESISTAREQGLLAATAGADTLYDLIGLAQRLRAEFDRLT